MRVYILVTNKRPQCSGHTRDSAKSRHRLSFVDVSSHTFFSYPRCQMRLLFGFVPFLNLLTCSGLCSRSLNSHPTASMVLHDTFVFFGFDSLSIVYGSNLALSEACLQTALHADILYLSLQEWRQLRVTTETRIATFSHLMLP